MASSVAKTSSGKKMRGEDRPERISEDRVDRLKTSEGSEADGDSESLELASRMIQMEMKRYYVDVLRTRSGKIVLRIVEADIDGHKERMTFNLCAAAVLCDHLTDFSNCYARLYPVDPEHLAEGGYLRCKTMDAGKRRYYLDLKENGKGRFLRISQRIDKQQRTYIFIPAQGLIEFRNVLLEMLDEFGRGAKPEGQQELPADQSIRGKDEMIHFNARSNRRGVFLRLTEVRHDDQYCASIAIPEKFWPECRDMFADLCERMEEIRSRKSEKRDGQE